MKKNYLQSMFGFTLHTNFKLRNFAILLVTLFGLLVPQSVLATGNVGYKGVLIYKDGYLADQWFRIWNGSWDWGGCGDYQFKDATMFDSYNFGSVNSLYLKGYGVVGWNDESKNVEGHIYYKIYKQSETEPGGNTGDFSVSQNCESDGNRAAGDKKDIDLLSGKPVGDYYFKVYANGWNKDIGSREDNARASFTIPGFEIATGTLDFGDISTETELTDTYVHFGGGLTLEDVTITGTNANEFQKVSISETGVTVRCLASTVGEKTATLTITDEWEKTRVVTLTANVEIHCDDPFTLNSITQSINKCDVSKQINAITAASGSIPSNATYAWTPAASVSDATIPQPNFIGTASEELNLTITNEDAPQCFATATANITYNDNTPTASITTATDKIIQPGATLSLQATATNYETTTWSTTTGGGSFADASELNTTYTAPTTVGDYVLTLTVSNGSCDDVVKTITVKVKDVYQFTVHFASKEDNWDKVFAWQNNTSNTLFGPWEGQYGEDETFHGVDKWKVKTNTEEFDATLTEKLQVVILRHGHAQINDTEIIGDLCIDGNWVSKNMHVWFYINGTTDKTTDFTITYRSELDALITSPGVTTAYGTGENDGRYSDLTWAPFKAAYEDAVSKCGAKATNQDEITAAELALQTAYNNLAEPCSYTCDLADMTVTFDKCAETKQMPIVTLSDGSALPASMSVFKWTPSNGLTQTNIAQPEFTGTTGAVYNLKVSDPNEAGCVGNSEYTVTINDNSPTANITTAAQNLFPDATLVLAGTVADNDSYTWTATNADNIDITAAVLTNTNTLAPTFTAPSTEGDITIKLTAIKGACEVSSEVVLSVNAEYNLTINYTSNYTDYWKYIFGYQKNNIGENKFLGNYCGTKGTEYTSYNGIKWRKTTDVTINAAMNEQMFIIINDGGDDNKSRDEQILNYLYVNGSWIAYNMEIWAYANGDKQCEVIITFRKDLFDFIKKQEVIDAYNGGTKPDKYTEYSYNQFKNAYEVAKNIASAKASTQDQIDAAFEKVKEKYEALNEGDLEPRIICDENGLVINGDNKVVITVTNKGAFIDAISYNVKLTDFGVDMPLEEAKTDLEPNDIISFTSRDAIANINDYNITASVVGEFPTSQCNLSDCNRDIVGINDTIFYTVDNSLTEDDLCRLKFRSLETAIRDIKADANYYNSTSKALLKHIVIKVAATRTTYVGTEAAGFCGGETANAPTIKIEDINNCDNPDKFLIIRKSTLNKPLIQHIIIRKSRNVTLNGLTLLSNVKKEHKDNALDIDNGDGNWALIPIGKQANSNINIKNCFISSEGFTCVHVAGIDSINFVNNDIYAQLGKDDLKDENTSFWGASVKFISSSRVVMSRNTIRGDHATSLWTQGIDKMLVMNNVFWSNNNATASNVLAKTAIVRLVVQCDLKDNQEIAKDIKNVGIYYNTMFLANGESDKESDFFRLGTYGYKKLCGWWDGVNKTGYYKTETIDFKYNNCYSYDLDVPGRPSYPAKTNTFLDLDEWAGLDLNNFWSMYDQNKEDADPTHTASVFGFGTNAKYFNVKSLVCKTGADSPGSLVIRGIDLNIGPKPDEDASQMKFAINTVEDYRYADAREGIDDGEWTLGAYQQLQGTAVDTIIWQGGATGATSDWDNRNNYIKTNGLALTCVDNLAEKLIVIVPAPNSTVYTTPVAQGGIKYYPIIPEWDGIRPSKDDGEQVEAGCGIIDDPTKFASKIFIEYGGRITGVENLVEDDLTMRYDTAHMPFIAQREEYILVGTAVLPFKDGTLTKEVRDVKSGDFYLHHQPHVYMHEAKVDGAGVATWNGTFTQLDEGVPATKAFAVKLPNQYGIKDKEHGNFKFPSEVYFKVLEPDPTRLNDGVQPKTYDFIGRFYNESGYTTYSNLTEHVPVLLNHTYPSNIDPYEITTGTVQVYHYANSTTSGSFGALQAGDLIKPQHGFVFTPGDGQTELVITPDMLIGGSTAYRSIEQEKPFLTLRATNGYTNIGSYIKVSYDEFKGIAAKNSFTDAPKLFAAENSHVPEIYIMMYDSKLSAVDVESTEKIIPLGLKLSKQMNVRFALLDGDNYDVAILEDRETGETYDLLTGDNVLIRNLPAGIIEGRFFLNTGVDVGTSDDTVTGVEDETLQQSIQVFTNGSELTISASQNMQLQKAYVTDMSGKTVAYDLKGNFDKINLNVTTGVYIVNIISDLQTFSTKVVIKD